MISALLQLPKNNYQVISLLVILAGCLLLLVLYTFLHTRSLRLTRYQITLTSLPPELNGLTILQLSDLHSKLFGKQQSRLFSLLNSLSFDIVALTGDMISKMHPDYTRLEEFLQQLNNAQNKTCGKPLLFVYGNHELWIGRTTTGQLQNHGVQILNNEAFYYQPAQPDNKPSPTPQTALPPAAAGSIQNTAPGIWIIGVDDPHQGQPDLQTALNGIPADDRAPKILLAHAPSIFAEAAAQKIDLVLTGHTHGGQICLPIIGALYAPGQSFCPEYVYGLYRQDATQMIITAGLGESNLPIRLFNKPEVVLIELSNTSSS